MTPGVYLEPVRPEDMASFTLRLQRSFTHAAKEVFPDFGEVIPPQRDIDESLLASGAEALNVMCEGRPVGGAIVTGDPQSKFLDFIFVDTEHQNRHLGSAAWQAIEARYPDAERWTLVTPYHERRNIHFYINKCGFHITEYYNEHHPNPDFPAEEGDDYPGMDGGLFKFEKTE